MRPSDLIAELRDRRVFTTTWVYALSAFVLLQAAEPGIQWLGLPDWSLTALAVALGLGFPVAVALAWTYDLSRWGILRTPPRVSSRGPLRHPTGAGLAVVLAVLGIVGVAGALSARELRVDRRPAPSALPSIAVLPFEDLSPGRSQDHLADGIAEEILMELCRVPGIHVAGRTSSFGFKGSSEDLRTVGRKLRVQAVLEGSVRRDGDRLRVTAHLVSVSNGYRLWSETYERSVASVFQTQDEIARAVVNALTDRLAPASVGIPRTAWRTTPEAYDLYLQARRHARANTQEETERAVSALQRALALDAGYAPAWALLANRYMLLVDFADTPEARAAYRERATHGVERALALEPGLPDGWVARAELRQSRYEWTGARADAERAVALAPGDATALLRLASLNGALGDTAAAVPLAERALSIDPLHAGGANLLGSLLLQAGRTAEAAEAFDRVLATLPRLEAAIFNRGVAAVLLGRPEEAQEIFRRNPAEMYALAGAALAGQALGHRARSEEALRELSTRFGHTMAYQIAQIHAWRGEADAAFEWLERAVKLNDGGLEQVVGDPLLRPLHGDLRYDQLLVQLGFPAARTAPATPRR